MTKLESFFMKVGGALIVFAFSIMGAYILMEFMLLGT
jgi:hypothetical protein